MLPFAACLPRAHLILASLISAEDAIRMGVAELPNPNFMHYVISAIS
jgi:hypothetical protein